MELIEIFGYIGALIVGVTLGLMGGGGSIIAIPILTYLFHINPITTTAYSLFVVGTSSSIGTLNNWKKGLIEYKLAVVFAIPAFLAVYVVRKYLMPLIPMEIITVNDFVITKDIAIMVFFAVIMIFSATSMIKKKKIIESNYNPIHHNYLLIVIIGIIIGLLTGVIGIGGGFIIIPALVLLLKIEMKKAVATTLFIIAIKSLVGFLGDLGNTEINWGFLLIFTTISISGIFFGHYLSSYIKGSNLKKSFGWMVLFIAFAILYIELF
ncbi:sulfite exporter TauE/SafE family protein [Tamlana fucoidanivorans]|uniref:Probable membrane transporter protein n=1 Tax=Allotamlana fucoidanivorans TaxID=2583814 RepID=A0A5C4SMH8_9FLAO|nr:sulfite exporter TauE/SafE family protein [Tamlana fucoidanivorans]TNJ45279.1 sulfite exporter TauE/SafE family protein [Tamlana fucoidanivorans]